MGDVIVEGLGSRPVARQDVELVERKGIGHPDTVCDAVVEAISHDLCAAYVERAGRVLHHNIDKALLVAGRATPAFGGGEVSEPMRLIVGDRATDVWGGRRIPVQDIAEAAAGRWVREHLRHVEPRRHLVLENALRPGSAQLADIFARDVTGANDTSAGVGFAPLSPVEDVVLAAERFLNSAEFKAAFPETGEDVKVMALRRGRSLELTVAMAFVGAGVPDERTYFDRKEAARAALAAHLEGRAPALDDVRVVLNALDRRSRGVEGAYLTVLGTSADGADGGEVGRGNRQNGLISFHRPVSTEAVAGKNPVSHVGKIYNLLAGRVAAALVDRVAGLEEVYVTFCSRIGDPLDRPWLSAVRAVPRSGVALADLDGPIRDVVVAELHGLGTFIERLVREGARVC